MQKIIFEPESGIDSPFVSVLVTAYNRKEYILEAVKSVLNQTIERSKYEIIVVKNYLDYNIDKFLSEYGVINIYTDELSLGAKLAYGIEKARGEILCFLEDDDMFLPNKLNEVTNIFHSNNKIFLARNNIFKTFSPVIINSIIKINSKNFHCIHEISISNIKSVKDLFHIRRKYSFFNTSSISIRKDPYVKSSNFLKDVNNGIDLFLFYFGIFNGSEDNIIAFQEQTLSIYRLHNSWSQISSDQSTDNFVKQNLMVSYQGIEAYEKFKTIFNTNAILNEFLIISINAWMVQIKMIEGKKINFTELISLIKVGIWKRSAYILLSVPLVFMSFINRNYSGYLFKNILKKIQSFPAK